MRVAILGLIRLTKGGLTLDAALDMPLDELENWTEAALELERRIKEASK